MFALKPPTNLWLQLWWLLKLEVMLQLQTKWNALLRLLVMAAQTKADAETTAVTDQTNAVAAVEAHTQQL